MKNLYKILLIFSFFPCIAQISSYDHQALLRKIKALDVQNIYNFFQNKEVSKPIKASLLEVVNKKISEIQATPNYTTPEKIHLGFNYASKFIAPSLGLLMAAIAYYSDDTSLTIEEYLENINLTSGLLLGVVGLAVIPFYNKLISHIKSKTLKKLSLMQADAIKNIIFNVKEQME